MSEYRTKEVTTRQVRSVRFSIYTEDEVRRMSVKRISVPLTRDQQKLPVPGGLYDPAMGPTDTFSRCVTCGLGPSRCPGHFGHIELPVPVYNPMLFAMLYRLVRCTCPFCYHLKLAQAEIDKYEYRLQRLAAGQLTEGMEAAVGKEFKHKLMTTLLDEQVGGGKAGYEAGTGYTSLGGPPRRVFTQHTLEAMQDTLSAFWRRCNKARCDNCSAQCPTIKRQMATRLFMVWPNMKVLVNNAMKGLKMRSGLMLGAEEASRVPEMEAQMAAELQAGKKPVGDADSDADMEDADPDPESKDGAEEAELAKLEDLMSRYEGATGPEVAAKMLMKDDEGAKGGGKKAARAAAVMEAAKSASAVGQPKYMSPAEVMAMMAQLWQHEAPILNLIFAATAAAATATAMDPGSGLGPPAPSSATANDTYKMFFLNVLAVAPNKFRPASKLGEDEFEHVQNTVYLKILTACADIANVNRKMAADKAAAEAAEDEGTAAADAQPGSKRKRGTGPAAIAALAGGANSRAGAIVAPGEMNMGQVMNRWLELQQCVAELLDSTMAEKCETPGIRQQIEKKEGLFRKHMMGKRVNYAARSVISPDPYIATSEIGIPPYFAKRLSFAEPVTSWNVDRLRQAVINGHDTLPGALMVEMENGTVQHLTTMSKQRREALAKQLLGSNTDGRGLSSNGLKVGTDGMKGIGSGLSPHASKAPTGRAKTVYRHLRDGDIMLTNRQPTLHKPGLMAHTARVLKGQKTIRMHYANCATFNADFDGDEINLHLPQDQLGRAEGYTIVAANEQYIVPTDGKPIRGLIQDHVVSGTLLAKRDTFFTRQEYSQLLYVGCTVWRAGGSRAVSGEDIILDPPAMLKPRPLWTGKQVIAGVVRYHTRAHPPLTFRGGGKVPAAYWGTNSWEDELEFLSGYLIRGCVDKNQFGKYGLVHAIQELYGNAAAGAILSSFSRLFTYYLTWHGFTCGFDDLLLKPQSEAVRANMLGTAEAVAIAASAAFVGQTVDANDLVKDQGAALPAASQQVAAALSARYRAHKDTGKAHDMKGSGVMHPLSSSVIRTCLPSGQIKPFPDNCLSLMTISGAKGSLVNFSQISCLLGQQELEGRRVPRMASGKTLPCFRAYDGGARSCGFVGDRFLTGLRPQEYYFHCMAGREGLVDTTVKTSRSGYLQRCLVKNLESLRVHYDGTVRDNCDGSVVQMYYGEDALDVLNVSHMTKFDFLARNAATFAQRLDMGKALAVGQRMGLTPAEQAVAAALHKRTKGLARLQKAKAAAAANPTSTTKARKLTEAVAAVAAAPPVMALQPGSVLGSTSEAFSDALQAFVDGNPGGVLADKTKPPSAAVPNRHPAPRFDGGHFQQLMQLKYMRSMAAPGEAVGVIAAQSIGEPSTQMTLNTFHMAGRGEANVTLGIPRLREILMAAAVRIRTPVMTLPLHKGMGSSEAKMLASRLRKLRLAECLKGISMTELPVVENPGMSSGYGRQYRFTFHFHRQDQYPPEANLTFQELSDCFRTTFAAKLEGEINKEAKKKGGGSIGSVSVAGMADEAAGATGAAGTGDEEGGEPPAHRSKTSKDEAFEDYDADEDLRDAKLMHRGGRGEAATYEGPDADDLAANAAGQPKLHDEEEEDEEGVEVRTATAEDEQSEDEQTALAPASTRAPTLSKGGAAAAVKAETGAVAGQPAAKKQKRSAPSTAEEKASAKAAAAAVRVAARAAAAAAKAKAKMLSGSGLVMDDLAEDDPNSGAVDEANARCHLTLTLPLDSPQLLMLEIVERVAAATCVRQTPGIEKVYVIDATPAGDPPKAQTDGITFPGVWAHSDLIDVHALTTNDVHAMLVTYGVEAARATIMHEAQAVFAAYGIAVDPRHLSLIADFMTHQGGYRACNRMGIESSVSPLLKMSFETAAHFLTDATLKGTVDDLLSPAARIVVGRVVELGTGVMDLMQNCA